ncbi:VCBS repeat-containing protein [Maribacter sp. CXY002]|uniref:VCBS repeat-containing protein n=1 Tax=Maribacter luteocoastalis TaxID=3407671 RepID=UPI003B681925
MGKGFWIVFLSILLIACDVKDETLFTKMLVTDTGIAFNNKIVETDSFNILTEEYIFNGGGVAVADFDNDGRQDLFFTGNQVANKLYLNKGGFKFMDVSSEAKISARDRWCTGVAIVDINNDGLSDVYVASAMSDSDSLRANMLFVNQGKNVNNIPYFKEMASEYGIAETGNSMGAAFFDYDKDGHLDLYVLNNEQIHALPTNYRPKVVDGSAVSNDRLYHNDGNGTFTDVTKEAGILIEGFGLGVAVADINSDGWPDIHISNDYITNDILYINNGNGTFSNKIGSYIRHQSKFSMGCDISDYDNDGNLDIITLDMLGETNYRMKTTIGHNNYINYVLDKRYDYERQYSRNMLHKGNGADVPFSEVGQMAGIAKTDWSWSPLFMDVDNDGYKDLLITNGFPRDITDKDFGDFRIGMAPFLAPKKILDSMPIVKIPNYAFKNKGNGEFENVGHLWGLNIPSFSNGSVFVDLDQDGDLDYVVNNINDNAFVFKNNQIGEKNNNRYLKIRLEGPKSNNKGIGAKITLRFPNEELQYYEHYLTRGYMSSVDEIAHFGLGSNGRLKSIEVVWPDGNYQKINNVTSNKIVYLKHEEAKPIEDSALAFPFTDRSITQPFFVEVSKQIGIETIHKEKDIVDYNVQRVLPHKLSQNGPCLAVGDLNGDQLEDFILGSSSTYSPMLYLQDINGKFSKIPLFSDKENMKYEEESMVLFDLDNDGDLDLYLVSGSNEFSKGQKYYEDRLMLNDGLGNFTFGNNRMPNVYASGSVVKTADFNNDGYLDLFVGGRTPIGEYPMPDKSYLLKNNNGYLEDVTDEIAPGLRTIGMVTDATWTDINNDGSQDLIIVGELMPMTIFINYGQNFEHLHSPELNSHRGWWESIVSEDFDNDGDKDFVIGNIGANNFFQVSKEKPLTIIAKDFDNNGSIDPISFAYFKNSNDEFDSFPVNFWGDLFGQSPIFRSKFRYYKEYALTTQDMLFTNEELKGTTKIIGNYDKTSFIENLGDNNFKVHALPSNAQIAPVNGIQVIDYNNDNRKDLLLIGNDFGNETFIGQYDAFNGLLMEGEGNGKFKPVSIKKSGFLVPGDAKSIMGIKGKYDSLYIVTQNRGKLLVFKKSQI